MKSPVKVRRQLVAKAPLEIEIIPNDDLYKVKEMTVDDVSKDPWLSERKKAFENMLSVGHIGIVVLNQEDVCVAYSFIAIGNNKPGHLPRIPANSAWCHYARVKDDYRGKGIHRMMMYERNQFIKEVLGISDIYADTSEDNLPSRINQKRLGYIECGIYYTLEIGTRRLPYLHLLLGYWNKNKKHPKIKKSK